MFLDFEENEYNKIFDNADFGYFQITVNRPERDENGNIVYANKGKPKTDNKLKDSENIPLKEDIQEFLKEKFYHLLLMPGGMIKTPKWVMK